MPPPPRFFPRDERGDGDIPFATKVVVNDESVDDSSPILFYESRALGKGRVGKVAHGVLVSRGPAETSEGFRLF